MGHVRKTVAALSVVSAACLSLTAPAFAGGSVKDEPVPAGREFTWSVNAGGTTDYVFRGVSQSAEDPVIQGGVDIGYGIFYAGAWASGIEFGQTAAGRNVATVEVDYYAGIKPVLGPLTFDLGVIYYTYPGARDGGPGEPFEQDYVEIKGGVSGSPFAKASLGFNVFYSPEYTGKQGETWTLEGTAGYELPKVFIFTPTIGGTLGTVLGDVGDGFVAANGKDEYLYWNVGLALAVDKLTLDFRYWDTDISDKNGFCSGPLFQCDERFVFSAKVTLP